jgi:serine/threonine protein kinase
MSVKAPVLNTLTNTQQPRRGVKSPCTRSQTRRAQESSPQATTSANAEPVARFEELPDELLLHMLSLAACDETVPGYDGEFQCPTFVAGRDALVLGPTSRAARAWQTVHSVSRRWSSLANQVEPWQQLRSMDDWSNNDLNWAVLRKEPDDPGHLVWAASSTSREEGKKDKWHSVRAPGGDVCVVLVRECNEEGVSYDVVRWMGCLQAMHHPCIASLKLVRAFNTGKEGEHTAVHAGMDFVDTSVQKIVYGTLERTSHTVIGRPLPPVMLRSFLYQLLSALAWSHARGVAHGNLAPYRVLAKTLDAAKDQYLLKLGDFGFSPPHAALCNEELPIRPSRASPELQADNKHKHYGPANDLWALGTVFAEMACGNRDPQVYMMIQDLDMTPEGQLESSLHMLCDDGRNLLRKMLKKEWKERITAADALCHPYFDGLHDQCEVVARYLPQSMPAPTRFLDLRVPQQWTPGLDFLAKQPHLNARMWTILYDWLAVVSFKFKFVSRSLQVAGDFMMRYMSQVQVERKELQLVGIGALCLACKHEEVMIPNMNDFIFICDSAYTLPQLMVMEVKILTTLQLQLHVPTAHDMLLPYLVELGEAPEDPSQEPYSPLRAWCECLLLLGQAAYPVVMYDPAVLARCVATLGGLLSRGVHSLVTRPDGSVHEGHRSPQLHERVCWLKPGADWECLRKLLDAVEQAAKDQREMLVKCHHKFLDLCKLEGRQGLLEKYRKGDRKQTHLTPQEVRPLLEDHLPIDMCKSLGVFQPRAPKGAVDDEGAATEEETAETKPKKMAYLRGVNPKDGADVYSIVGVTCALGKQLLKEYDRFMAGTAPTSPVGA